MRTTPLGPDVEDIFWGARGGGGQEDISGGWRGKRKKLNLDYGDIDTGEKGDGSRNQINIWRHGRLFGF